MAKKDDDLESQMAAAAKADDFATWQSLNRQFNAQRGGRSYINGQPAAEVIGTSAQVAANNPVLPVDPPQYANTNQTDHHIAMMEKYGVTGAGTSLKGEEPLTRDQQEALKIGQYNRFLLDSGIEPNSIGNATVDENGRMEAPSIAMETAARDQVNRLHGVHNKYANAAGRLRQNNPAASLALDQEADSVAPNVAQNRSSQGNLQYWLNKLRSYRGVQQSNGFASNPQ